MTRLTDCGSRSAGLATALALGLLLLLLPASAMATAFYEYYALAKQAIADGDLAIRANERAAATVNYKAAVEYLRLAIEIRPESRLKARTYGLADYEDYTPYYWMGRAFEGMGDATLAAGSYETELTQKAIFGNAQLLQDLQARLRSVRAPATKTPTVPPLSTPTPSFTALPTTPATATPSRTSTPTPRLTAATRTAAAVASKSALPTRSPTPAHSPSPTGTATSTRVPPTATPTSSPSATVTPSPLLEPVYDQPRSGEFLLRFSAYHPAGVMRVALYIDSAFTSGWDNPSGSVRFDVQNYAFELIEGATYEAELVAIGADGTRVTHQELLRPGTTRIPTLLIAIPVSVGSALAGSLLMRRRRRRQVMGRSFNPYIAGSPVIEEDMFFGRTGLLQQVLSTLHNNSLLLFGERRIGKTSLLHSIYRHVARLQDEEYDFYPVLIDLEGVPEEAFFSILMSEILAQLDKKLHALPVRYRPDLPKSDYDASHFVSDLRLILRTLREGTTKTPKLLLLLDEVDVLNTFSSRTNQRLRSLFMKTFGRHLGLVMAGVGIRKSWDSEGSPWYNFFEEIPVKPFTVEEARELIRRPVQGVFSYGANAVERIIEACESKPYLIQRCCIACVTRVSAEGRFTIDLADVEAVLPNVLGGRE